MLTRLSQSSRQRALVWAAPFVAAGACVLAGCPTTAATTTFVPITGVVIKSAALVTGFGCGQGPTEVFRYVAVLNYAVPPDAAAGSPTPVGQGSPWTNVFDCFTDGVFENLPALNGNLDFTVAVYAYDQAAYEAAGLPPDLGCAAGAPPDGAACPLGNLAFSTAQANQASWTTTCQATEQLGVPVLAVCAPLTSQFPAADAGIDAGDAGDGGTEDAPSTSADAEAGTPEASLPDAGTPEASLPDAGDASNDG
jgi:hypothetical protein